MRRYGVVPTAERDDNACDRATDASSRMTDQAAAVARPDLVCSAAVRERDAALAERDAARADLERALSELASVTLQRDSAQNLDDTVMLGTDPARTDFVKHATKQDIYYCFRLLLGRNPNPEEWPGHLGRAGKHLTNVVSAFVTSREFCGPGMLDQTYLGEIELLNLPGFQLYVSREDLGVGFPLLWTGAYEPEIGTVFRRRVKPGMAVLDIGANIGYFTMISASIVGPSGTDVAVEPNPGNVKLLEASRRQRLCACQDRAGGGGPTNQPAGAQCIPHQWHHGRNTR
jgi:hypothetical protein